MIFATLFFAAIELVAPARDATVRLVPSCQRAVITNDKQLQIKVPDNKTLCQLSKGFTYQ